MRLNRLILRIGGLLMLLTLLCMGVALADDLSDFTFSVDGEAVTVVAYNGSASSVKVPDWYEGLKVLHIGANAFRGNTTLETVYLPSHLKSIGSGAFAECPMLKNTITYDAAAEPPAEDERTPGDVNEDGKINSRDALAVLKHAAGQEVNINTANADVNADGKINSRDALAILKYAAGQDVTLK